MNLTTFLRSAAALLISALPLAATAQDYGAMVQRSMAAMNANIARGQQMVQGIVQQRMQDPQVQAMYRQHVAQAQASGRAPMDYANFTYYYVYTNGYSAQGMAHMRSTEAGNQARERAAWQGLQQAQAQRAQAQQGLRDGYYANQAEAGRQLMGNSSYQARDGSARVLPHTWQRNTTHVHQGQTYHVDAGGQYYQRGADGWWYPLAAR
ncbi:hypothetical protein HLB44_21715 [Aquincola sp. S2]|uniref:Uncharacterized protein n=1 Tax=Pseudaquabacterium terrae TaxID=2732868 RepID=A0ABX2EM27_9BURK|nr:hypothetical protein [Aquabacterium terrae]NRF69625.1 hypothetical protein [Aquabacterium terrae]